MTHDEHKARHKLLHEAFDELLADYFRWNPGKMPSTTTGLELLLWSSEQTHDPRHDSNDSAHSYAVCAHCGELVTTIAPHECPAEKMEHDR